MLLSFWALTKNSFTEIIRQPVYGILVLVGMVLIGFSPAITMFSMAQDESLMVDMALATIFLLGLVMAVLSATHVISREIEHQTVGAIISKPVGRGLFVLSKFAAVSLAMAMAWYLMTVVTLITLRIGVPTTATWKPDLPAFIALLGPLVLAFGFALYANYFYQWNFTSTALMIGLSLYTVGMLLLLVVEPGWGFALVPRVFIARHARQVFEASALVFLGVWVLSSIAVAASTRLNVVMNVILCLTVFFVGMISQYLFGRFADGSIPAWLALRVIPSLHVFWVGDQLMAELPYIPPPYIAVSAAYAVGFCAAMVAVAAFLFERREVI